MTATRRTVYIETYGCQMNVSDSELMLGKLTAQGYDAVEQPDGADLILVNTCAIRDHAEQRVIGRIGELKRHMKADTVLGVTGCMAQRLGPQLLGQTVNSYSDGEHDFADLLRAVGAVPGVRRVRFTSPHPNDFSDRVIRAIAEVPTVCEHVHLPMQSGSTRTLRRMLRRYTREQYFECVERLRRAVPGLALTTDIIVGFPGETDEEFEETLSAVRQVGFADAFTFIFSPRDGTPATRMPAELTVPEDVAGERMQRLIGLVRCIARERNLRLLGTSYEVLVEKL